MSSDILVIDHGNSVLKAFAFRGDEEVARAQFPAGSIEEIAAFVNAHNSAAGIYSTVTRFDVRFIESLRCLLPEGMMVLTDETSLPIEIAYLSPQTLGADRIAAAVGASVICPEESVLIADAGTALTLDILAEGKRFIGGNISAGVGLRLRALHDHTGRLPLVNPRPDVSPFGSTTEEALQAGAQWGMTWEIEGAMAKAGREYGCSKLVLTGGDAHLIASMLSSDIDFIISDNLVAVGLNNIFRYNEKI